MGVLRDDSSLLAYLMQQQQRVQARQVGPRCLRLRVRSGLGMLLQAGCCCRQPASRCVTPGACAAALRAALRCGQLCGQFCCRLKPARAQAGHALLLSPTHFQP